ncbi:5-formyltetrahydrofolate cyclo-ligase [Georgenia sp. M64]|uniref:5-formyltetrahydrofolate cyclo-ligase n=1 Tax=Georgenia sp. M64 TaxID=3120520 RepID=UPI0030E21252
MERPQIPLPRTDGYEAEDAKQMLRQIIREHRAQRPPQERAEVGRSLVPHVLEAVGAARTVAAWVSQGTEPSTLASLAALHEQGCTVLLPVLGPGLNRTWGHYTSEQDLAVRAPGRPPEPSGPVLPAEAVADADVVLIPALAIDAHGTRLGQGGGWYDRVLVHTRPGTPVFAVIHAEELVGDVTLPRVEHDVPVGAVITPAEWFLLEGSAFRAEALANGASAVDHLAER